MSRNNDNMDTSFFLGVVFLIIAIFVIPAVYAAKADIINGAFLLLAKIQLKSFVPFSEEAQKAWDHIVNIDPASLTWDRMQAILSYTGKWIRWPLAFLLGVLGAVSIFMSRTSKLTRRFNMESLLKNNAESFPCLRPVVGRGAYLLSPDSYDSGPWRFARSPIQFALEHGLLVDANGNSFSLEQALHKGLASVELPAYGNGRLDEDKALIVFQEQLGRHMDCFDELNTGRKALASAFLAYASGNKNDCLKILDAVSSSYTEQEVPVCPVLDHTSFQNRLAKTWEKHSSILSEPLIVRHSAFELVWFMALLTQARKKGVLASSQFLWLRPLDRPLWYALNQCGGRAAWAEGFAPWAHYVAEEKARKALSEPHVLPAITSLRDSLSSQGWFPDTPRAIFVPQDQSDAGNLSVVPESREEIEPVPDMVYAQAEDNPEEYDANEDEELAQEQV